MDIRVVLLEPEHEGNVGSIARIIKNFGFDELWLVDPKMKLGIETKIFAMHAGEVIEKAVIVNNLDEAFKGVKFIVGTTAINAKKSSNVLRILITPEELANRTAYIKEKIAIVFGRESRGLSNDELAKCDVIVTIPSSPFYRTLNVASASAIILYELWKAKANHPKGYFKEVDADKRKRIIRLFNQLSKDARITTYKRRLANQSFHNIISRALISQREATLIIGVLRKLHNSKQ